MIDNYAVYGIVVRSFALVIFILVIKMQIQQFKEDDKQLNGLKKLLLVTTLLLVAGNLTVMLVNFLRQSDGNLIVEARHASTIFNASATLMVSITLYLIYKYRAKGDK